MDFDAYKQCLRELPFGKRLPTAVYLHRGATSHLGPELEGLIERVAAACEVGEDFNVLKFSVTDPRISFLCYPRFFEDPAERFHTLHEALRI